jgi:hypothetical protein
VTAWRLLMASSLLVLSSGTFTDAQLPTTGVSLDVSQCFSVSACGGSVQVVCAVCAMNCCHKCGV